MVITAYRHKAPFTDFRIVWSRETAWAIWWRDDNLGDDFDSPEAAVENLVGGTTYWPSACGNPGVLGLSEELDDWEPITAA